MGYLFSLIPLILDVILIVHVFRTGRERFWVFIIVFIPLAGCIAYVIVESLPGLIHGREAFGSIVRQHGAITDDRELLCYAMTLEARYRYSSFLKKTGRNDDAKSQIRTMMTGFEFLPRYVRQN